MVDLKRAFDQTGVEFIQLRDPAVFQRKSPQDPFHQAPPTFMRVHLPMVARNLGSIRTAIMCHKKNVFPLNVLKVGHAEEKSEQLPFQH